VGGSSRIPLVSSLVRRRFGRADFKGDPKTAVALGAAQTTLAHRVPEVRKEPERVGDPPPASIPTPPTPPAPVRPVSLRDELARDPRRELLLDLVEELTANVADGLQRVLVLRHVALLDQHGIGVDVLFDYATKLAGDFTVLRAWAEPASDAKPWGPLRALLAPLQDRWSELDSDLPWTRQVAGWRRVAHPMDGRREAKVAKGKTDAAAHGKALLAVLSAAARERPVLCLLHDVPRFDATNREALGSLVRALIGYSETKAPERILMLLSGGYQFDPWPGGKAPPTSLNPGPKVPRRKWSEALGQGRPFTVHQPLGAPVPLALAAKLDSAVRHSGLGAI